MASAGSKGEYQSKTVSVGQEAVDEFYSVLAKKTGIDNDRVQSIVNRNGQEVNAQYDPTRNKMTTSATAENELQASIHELVHAAFAYNTEKMKLVKKAVIDYFLSQNSESEFEEILRQYGASYEGNSRAEIEEEFVADALGGMFSTEDGVQDFLNWLQEESGYNEEKKKDILQRITEWLNDIIEAIRDIMNSGELNGAGKFFAKENCDELTRIRKQFLEALDGAGENYREGGAVEGAVRNSFAGIKAKTSNIQTFEAAQRLEDVGKATPEEIRQQTGWFRGMDGMWRFEIDDSKMIIRDIDIRSGETKLSEVLEHPELFAAYPQLKDVTISAFPSIFRFGVKGSYNSERNEISLSDEFLVDAKVHRELEALKKSDEYRMYKEQLEVVAREHGEKRLKLSREYKKIREAKLYTDMVDLLYQLDDEGKVEEYKKVVNEWESSSLGKRYKEIQEELKKMDEINPQLEIENAFRESELGKRYHKLTLDVFSGGELINDTDTRSTLIHEIQHAVQSIEGFASGASPKYWRDINADPFSYTPSEIKKLEAVRKKASDYLNMLDDADIRDDAQRYWYLNDHYFDDNLDTAAVDKEIAEIEARAEAFGYQDKLDRYFELENKVTLTFNEIEKRRKRSPDELYRNTAGEIEARDVTYRLDLTDEERKYTLPDIDNAEAVFAEGGVSYSQEYETAKVNGEIIALIDKVKNHEYKDNEKVDLGIVPEKTAKEVKKLFGFDVSGYKMVIEARQVFHILKDHGIYSESDKSMSNDADIAKMEYAIKTYDDVRDGGKTQAYSYMKNGYNRTSPTILYEKYIGNKSYYVVQAVAETKKRTLFVVSAFIGEKGFKKEASQLINAKSLDVTAKTGSVVTSNNSISDSTENVNDSSKNSLPLSNLNDLHASNIENVKYSLKNSLDWVEFDDEKSLIREMSELDEIETELKEILKYEVRRQEISELNIQEVARKLRAEFRSTIDIHILSDMLRDYYNSFCGDSIVSWDVVQVKKNEIADAVLKNSKNNRAYIPEKYQEVLKEIKSVKVKPSEEQKRTAAAVYGSYEIFRRKTYSSIMFSKDGVDLNDRWQELSEKYPDVFSKDMSEKDRALAIFEATKMLKNRYEDEYGFDYDSAKDYMTMVIAESFFDVSRVVSPESKNRAKELEARIKKVKRDYGLKYKELSKNLQKRIDRMQDTEIRKRKRNRLIKTIKRLDRLLRNPGKGVPSAGTNKYGQEYVHLTNIPEGLKKTVIDFCSIFVDNDAGVFTAKYKDSEGVVRKKVFELLKQYGALKESKTIFIDKKSQDNEIKSVLSLVNFLYNVYDMVSGCSVKNVTVQFINRKENELWFSQLSFCGCFLPQWLSAPSASKIMCGLFHSATAFPLPVKVY